MSQISHNHFSTRFLVSVRSYQGVLGPLGKLWTYVCQSALHKLLQGNHIMEHNLLFPTIVIE